MNHEIEFWDGTYCMVCQDNYEDTGYGHGVENFLCSYCRNAAENGRLSKRIEMFEIQAAKYAHPSSLNKEPAKTIYMTVDQALDTFFGDGKATVDIMNAKKLDACEDCNDEFSDGEWYVSDEDGNFIAGPKCTSCYFEYRNATILNEDDHNGN